MEVAQNGISEIRHIAQNEFKNKKNIDILLRKEYNEKCKEELRKVILPLYGTCSMQRDM